MQLKCHLQQSNTALAEDNLDNDIHHEHEIKENNLENSPSVHTIYALSDDEINNLEIKISNLSMTYAPIINDITLSRHGYKKKRIISDVCNLMLIFNTCFYHDIYSNNYMLYHVT